MPRPRKRGPREPKSPRWSAEWRARLRKARARRKAERLMVRRSTLHSPRFTRGQEKGLRRTRRRKEYGRWSFDACFAEALAKAGCLIILSVKQARAGQPWRPRVNGCIVRDGRQECICNCWNRNLPDCRRHRGRGHCRNDSGVSLRDRRCRFQKCVWHRTAAFVLASVARAKARRATSPAIESNQNHHVVKRYHFTHA